MSTVINSTYSIEYPAICNRSCVKLPKPLPKFTFHRSHDVNLGSYTRLETAMTLVSKVKFCGKLLILSGF